MKSNLLLTFKTAAALMIAVSQMTAQESLSYTLKDYLKAVYNNNPDIQIARHDIKNQAAAYHQQRDTLKSPYLTSDYTFINGLDFASKAPAETQSWGLGARKLFPETGTSLNAGMKYSGKDMETDVTGPMAAFLGDSFSPTVDFGVNQSLLRGGPAGMIGKKQLDLGKEGVRIQRSIFNSKLEGMMLDSLSKYWQYCLTTELMRLTEKSVADASTLLEKNRARQRLGSVEQTEINESESFLVSRKADLDKTRIDLINMREKLLDGLNKRSTADYKAGLNLTESLEDLDLPAFNELMFETAFQNAMNKRESLKQALIAEKISRISYEMAKAALLPKLDMNLGFTFSTNYGSKDDVKWGKSVVNNDNFQFRIGLMYEMPLQPGAYKTVVEKAKSEYEQKQKTTADLKSDIRTELKYNLQLLEYNSRLVKDYSDNLERFDRNEAAYSRKYYNGEIDVVLLNQAKDRLRDAQRAKLSAIFQLVIQQAVCEIGQGIFLEKYGLTAEDVSAPVK